MHMLAHPYIVTHRYKHTDTDTYLNFSVFRYQHVGIASAKSSIGGLTQCEASTQVVLRCSGIWALVKQRRWIEHLEGPVVF